MLSRSLGTEIQNAFEILDEWTQRGSNRIALAKGLALKSVSWPRRFKGGGSSNRMSSRCSKFADELALLI